MLNKLSESESDIFCQDSSYGYSRSTNQLFSLNFTNVIVFK